MPDQDPFLIPPEIWFGVLCEGVRADTQKRIDVQRVFSRYSMRESPGRDSGPFAHMRAILAAGFSYGVGEFSVEIELHDVDGKVLWARPEPWTFTVGPGSSSGAVLAEPVEYFFTEPGHYYYALRVTPPGTVHRVRFEVHLPETPPGPGSQSTQADSPR